jgi:hypothetical protein
VTVELVGADRSKLVSTDEEQLSLWNFYLNAPGKTKEIYDAFVASDEGREYDFFKVVGIATKKEALQKWQEWARKQLEYEDYHEYLYLRTHAESFDGCKLGSVTIKKPTGELRKHNRCYFLARTADDEYKVCKAKGFIRHIPPGANTKNSHLHQTFAICDWLLSPTPARTEKSNLPLVVIPNESIRNSVKQHTDTEDKFLPRLWPVNAIHPLPVCGKCAVVLVCMQIFPPMCKSPQLTSRLVCLQCCLPTGSTVFRRPPRYAPPIATRKISLYLPSASRN